MEGLYSSTHMHFLPSNILQDSNSKHYCKIKALAHTQVVQRQELNKKRRTYFTSGTHKENFFAENDAFPPSLQLHLRNPRFIYKEIQRFARLNKIKEALTIMNYMDQQGIPVNLTTYASLIAACIRLKSLTDAKQIHAHIRLNGLENNEFLRTKLVLMYTSCGSIEDAKLVFDGCSPSSVYPWNALLRGNVILGGRRYYEVLSAYEQMRELGVELDVYTFSNILKSFAGASAFKLGLKVHTLLIKNGLIDSSLLRTSLVDLYFKCGKINLALKVFEEIPDRDIVSWGTIIAGLGHNRRQRDSLDYLRQMITEGIYPNSVVITTILPIIGELCARKLGQEIHCYVLKKRGYVKQLPIQSGFIDMYCKCGDMGSARRVFYSSMERNVICWTALMSGYASNGRFEQALRSMVWMQQEGFRPDVVAVATAIPVCAELRNLKYGKEIHAYAIKNMFLPNVSVTTSLIKMYSKCGILDYSVKLFEDMVERDVISWTAMIDAYLKHRCLEEAFCIFRSMLSSKPRPDPVIIARMLSACGVIKDSKLGKEVHCYTLKTDFLKIPFVSAELVKMYGRCGLIGNAKSAFNAIQVKGSMTWTAIIDSYGYNNLWRDAINLFDEMISSGFSPNHFTFEVMLAICNEAGLVDDTRRIVKLMSEMSQNKESKAHHFAFTDNLNSNRSAEEIQRTL